MNKGDISRVQNITALSYNKQRVFNNGSGSEKSGPYKNVSRTVNRKHSYSKPPLATHTTLTHNQSAASFGSEIKLGKKNNREMSAVYRHKMKPFEPPKYNYPVSLDPKDVKSESRLVDISKLKTMEGYKEFSFKEAIYIGTMNPADERDGIGIMKYKIGRQYEGEWKDDIRNGKGFERYANGNTYFGMFKNGKAHGKGVYTW